MSLAITSSSGTVTFADPGADYMANAGQYWHSAPHPDGPDYDVQRDKAPGEEGQNKTEMGFGSRAIENLEVIYVGASAQACRDALASNEATLRNKDCSVAMPDTTSPFAGCDYLPHKVLTDPKPSGRGTYFMRVQLRFRQDTPA